MEELNEIKKQFDELMAKAEEIVKKNGGKSEDERWRAEIGEPYYKVCSDSPDGFWARLLIRSNVDSDSINWETYNYFQTEEEAKKVAQHFKDYLILRADAKGFEVKDVSTEYGDYYYVCWSAQFEYLEPLNDGGCLSGTIYFETEKDAEASIAKHGDIWKRYLGVGE